MNGIVTGQRARARGVRCAVVALLAGCSSGAAGGAGGQGGQGGVDGCLPHTQTAACTTGMCPPGPPACGPGSAAYPHAAARVTTIGSAAGQYTIYEPDMPAPATAPVLAFVHGFTLAENRSSYESMLQHFAKKGYIVVFPEYGYLADVAGYLQNTRKGIADALHELQTNAHVKPDDHFGLFGHSLGGMLTLLVAASVSTSPVVPTPSVLVLHEPAGAALSGFTGIDLAQSKLDGIDPKTRLLIIEAQTSLTDTNTASPDAWNNTKTIPRAQKNWLLVHTDGHGAPALMSDHLGVQADVGKAGGAPLDAIDWWGYWRPTEAAFQEVFGSPGAGAFSAFCSQAGAKCDPVRDMGLWSDGVPVTRGENAADQGH
jgi:acetyl esterase/lipase